MGISIHIGDQIEAYSPEETLKEAIVSDKFESIFKIACRVGGKVCGIVNGKRKTALISSGTVFSEVSELIAAE